MKITLQSGAIIEIETLDDMKDLYRQLHSELGEKIKIVKDTKIVEREVNRPALPLTPRYGLPEITCNADEWDKQIIKDALNGRLDGLFSQAEQDYSKGRIKFQ